MTVTLKDIAAHAGVSATAVSHVLNNRLGHVRVSDAKRELIQEVAKKLGYVPNLRARSMVSKRSFTIGVVGSFVAAPLNHFSDIYPFGVLRGVEQTCRKYGYHVLFTSSSLEHPESFVPPRAMRDGSLDGAVLLGYTRKEIVDKIAHLGLACVQVGSNIDPQSGIDCVYGDLDGAFEKVARHLVGLGHRKVQLLLPAGPGPEMLASNFRALRGLIPGLEPEAAHICSYLQASAEGWTYAQQILERPDPPSAFICGVGHCEGLVRGLAEAGWRCPEDYSVVAFGASSFVDMRVPPNNVGLSMVILPIEETGRAAAEILIQRLGVLPKHPNLPDNGVVPCQVFLQGSCGPLQGERDEKRNVTGSRCGVRDDDGRASGCVVPGGV